MGNPQIIRNQLPIRKPGELEMKIAKNWQRIEGGIIFLSGLLIYWPYTELLTWWIALPVFFVPDLSFSGYIFGARFGAFLYNAVHIYALGAALIALGLLCGMPLLIVLGALWIAHSGFDRLLGYGLKSPEGFSITHLGRIGK